MKRVPHTFTQIMVALLACTLVGSLVAVAPAYAQSGSPITATVDRISLSTDETVNLTVVVSAQTQQTPQPELPALTGFNIVGTSTSSQVSIINGAVSSQIQYLYRLQPYEAGTLTIDPVTLNLNGQTFETEPIVLDVTQGTGQPQNGAPQSTQPLPSGVAGEELFVEALVDNPTPYVGEQVNYIFRFYEAANPMRMTSMFGRQPQYDAPEFTGFWTEGKTEQSSYRTQAAGQNYTVTELHTALFPTGAGEVTIDPATIVISGFGFQRGAALQADAVTVDVQPLPADTPTGFNGAVGNFRIESSIDAAETATGEPVTLKVTLIGEGNLNLAPDPEWPELSGWRSFDSTSTTETQAQDERVYGRRIYERVMIPGRAGDYTIPPIEYVYFNPTDEAYNTIATEPIDVSVALGAAGSEFTLPSTKDATASGGTESGAGKPANESGMTLRPAKQIAPLLAKPTPSLIEQPLYWLLWLVPLLALGAFGAWARRTQYVTANADALRSKRAASVARKGLTQTGDNQTQPSELGATADRILTDYLTARIGQPVQGMARTGLATMLAERGVSAELIERVRSFRATCEMVRFSPSAADASDVSDLAQQAQLLIDDLDTVLNETNPTRDEWAMKEVA